MGPRALQNCWAEGCSPEDLFWLTSFRLQAFSQRKKANAKAKKIQEQEQSEEIIEKNSNIKENVHFRSVWLDPYSQLSSFYIRWVVDKECIYGMKGQW